MLEAKSVNESLGVQIPLEMMDRRLAAAASVAGHKMSMLQDSGARPQPGNRCTGHSVQDGSTFADVRMTVTTA